MKIAIIGHRGSGKTHTAQKIAKYLNLPYFDLDKEIHPNTSDYFEEVGESIFREKEEEIFKKLHKENTSFVISLGAGYCKNIPNDVSVYWIHRLSDNQGRIFLDRPRLNKAESAYDEFTIRKKERDLTYSNLYTDKIEIPEGFLNESNEEKNLFLHSFSLNNYSTTICSDIFKTKERLDHYLKTRMKWEIAYFEIRDDLLNEEQISFLLNKIPNNKLLLSFRKNSKHPLFIKYLKENTDCRWDWAMELGVCEFTDSFDIYSCHDLNIKDAIAHMQNIDANVKKISPIVSSMKDLNLGHEWLTKNSRTSCFLPRSENGIWKWYRLFSQNSQSIQFFKDIEASALDQPCILEALYHKNFKKINSFAAVIGSPVLHSLSPAEHYSFFKEKNMPFYAIDIQSKEDFSYLLQLGAQCLAITAPLKKSFLSYVDNSSEQVKDLSSMNTLVIEKSILAENTDIAGVRSLKEKVNGSTAIWGGGGMLPILKQVFPTATSYSARTGESRDGEPDLDEVDCLIWSVGREHYLNKNAKWPPQTWKPKLIIDMNYHDNSPGKEYAQSTGANYISGMTVFKEQAKKQQDFWSKYVGK